MKSPRSGLPLWMVILLLSSVCVANTRSDRFEFDIPSQPLDESLQVFSAQARVRLLMGAEIPEGVTAPALKGRFTREDALKRLLSRSGATATFTPPDIVTLHLDALRPEPNAASAGADGSTTPAAIPETVVTGSRTLNTDQFRTSNDAFPYVVFDSLAMRRSGVADVRSFLATELPAFSPRNVALGAAAVTGAGDQITVRGLPSTETAILVDGHRRAGSYAGGDMQQPDVSMVPLEFLSRIDVRTASASALFGSDAVAGSINLVRDRKTPRSRFFLRTEHLTDISSNTQRFGAEHVMHTGNGWLALNAAFQKQDGVTLGQRDFVTGGREKMAANHPQAYADLPAPPLSDLRNLHAAGTSEFPVGNGARFLYLPKGFAAGDDLATLTENADLYSLPLTRSAQAMGTQSSLRPERRIYSASAAGGLQLADAFSVDLDLGFAESLREGRVSALDTTIGSAFFVPAMHPANPVRHDTWAAVGTDIADGDMSRRDRSIYAALGADWRLSTVTTIRLDHAWSSATATIRQPVLTGNTSGLVTLLLSEPAGPDALAEAGMTLTDETSPKFRNTVEETTLRVSRSDVAFPSGDGSVTFAAQRLFEKLAIAPSVGPPPVDGGAATSDANLAAQRGQRTFSFLASAKVPLADVRADDRGARLVAELGLRRDSVVIHAAPDATEQRTLRFPSFSGAAALRWQMFDRFAVRIQYATGFLPPPLSSLSDRAPLFLTDLHLVDPARGNEPLEQALITSGGDYGLRPERSHTWGGGFVWLGEEERWRLSMDYYRLVKTHVVLTPADLFFGDSQKYLTEYASRIQRAAPQPGDPWARGKITGIETWSVNVARQQVESVDIQFSSKTRLPSGDLVFTLLGAAQPVSTHRAASFSRRENDAGVSNLASPIWRGAASLTWARDGLELGAAMRYTSSYDVSRVESVISSQGSRQVASQNYVDVFAAYDLRASLLWGTTTQLRLDVTNVLGRDPPADLSERGYASRIGLDAFRGVSLSVNIGR